MISSCSSVMEATNKSRMGSSARTVIMTSTIWGMTLADLLVVIISVPSYQNTALSGSTFRVSALAPQTSTKPRTDWIKQAAEARPMSLSSSRPR